MTTDAGAVSRMGSVEIRAVGSTVCFSLSEEEERSNGVPLVHSLRVYQYRAGAPPLEIWGFRFPGDKTIKVDSRTCLPYGVAPRGAEAAAAPRLEPLGIYGVGMGGRTDRSNDSTQGYTGEFCVIPGVEGRVQVMKVRYGMRQHGETKCVPESAVQDSR